MPMAFYKRITIITTWLISTTIVGCTKNRSLTLGSATTRALRGGIYIEFIDALKADDTSRVKEMINSGRIDSDQSIDWWYRRTPLHLAAREGATRVVKFLINSGVDIAPEDKDRATPLHLASLYGKWTVVAMLIEANSELATHRDKQGYMALHRAIQKEKESESSKRPPLIRKKLVSCLLSDSIEQDIINRMIEARVEESEMFRLIKGDGYAAIHLGAQNGPLGAASHILEKGRDMLNNEGRNKHTPLHLAAKGKQAAIAAFFLEEGAEYNTQDQQGRTLLHYATACPRTAKTVINTLGEVEENFINSRDHNGRTPLHHAVINGYREVVELLVEKGADINAADNFGFTPLDLARKKPDIKGYLLRKQASWGESWYRIIVRVSGQCCGKLRDCVRRATEDLSPHIEKCECPEKIRCISVTDPCGLLYKILFKIPCCAYCDQQSDEERTPLLPETSKGNIASSSGSTP